MWFLLANTIKRTLLWQSEDRNAIYWYREGNCSLLWCESVCSESEKLSRGITVLGQGYSVKLVISTYILFSSCFSLCFKRTILLWSKITLYISNAYHEASEESWIIKYCKCHQREFLQKNVAYFLKWLIKVVLRWVACYKRKKH